MTDTILGLLILMIILYTTKPFSYTIMSASESTSMGRLRLCCKLHGLADIAHLLQKDPGFMGVYFLATRTIQTRFLVRVDKQVDSLE